MRMQRIWGLATALMLTGLSAGARADYIEYDLGTLGKAVSELAGAQFAGIETAATSGGQVGILLKTTKITLPGTVKVHGGPNPLAGYTHPTGKTVYFPLDDVKIIRAPTTQQQFHKILNQAGRDPESVMKAAVWALKKGLLPDFYKSVEKVIELDPTHESALKVRELKKQMKEPLPDNPDAEKRFKALVKRSNMKVEMSNHYMLMHDTPSKPPKGKTKTRAQQRLDLLEKVYESFMLLFHAQDVQLDIPKERMMVVLFQNYDDFKEYSVALDPSLASAAGFWDPVTNVAYFYDFGTDDLMQMLEKTVKTLREESKDAKKAKNNPDIIRYVQVIDLLLDVQRENSDINVVSHECTHQMAGNTGLFPRHIHTPKWVHEGLASYFEVPSDGVWAGIGAVSGRRVLAYRNLADADKNKLVSNISFVVTDQLFRADTESGYAFGWALTHFMIENHLKEFVAFYRILGEVPSNVILSPDLLLKLFRHVYGPNLAALDAEWKIYMKSLKTDLEKLEESEAAKEREKS